MEVIIFFFSIIVVNYVFLKYDIIKKHKLVFDKTLNKFGIGEDQLFFLKLNNYG